MTPTGTTPTTPDPQGEPTAAGDPELDYARDNAWLEEDAEAEAAAGPGWPALLAAEAFGTFLLVLAGVGTAAYAALTGIGGGGLAVALAFGLAVMIGIVAVGRVSGGHFNPAVTLGAAVAGRLPWVRVLPYWVAQVVGGIAGALVVFLTVPTPLPKLIDGKAPSVREYFGSLSNGFDSPATASSTAALHSPLGRAVNLEVYTGRTTALLIETVLTAVFVGVILAVTARKADSRQAPFIIGATLSVLVLVAMPLTNAALNPARALATAVFSPSWALDQVWLFWVAPLFGALVAGLLTLVFGADPHPTVEQDEDEDEDDVEVAVRRD